jgi:hypothetical protein
MKIIKCCKNCDKSLYIGTPGDPDWRHHCDIITSGLIKTESECKEHRYKYFSPKEHEKANLQELSHKKVLGGAA